MAAPRLAIVNVIELGLAPTRQQLEELELRFPGRGKVLVVADASVSLAQIEGGSVIRLEPPVTDPPNDLMPVRRSLGSADVA